MLAASLPRPSLGVQLRPVQVRVPARTGDASVGLLVLGCEERGAAARAGVLPGDVLLGCAGRPFRSADELALLLRDIGDNASLRLDIGRANKQLSITVHLGAAERLRTDVRPRAA
jgi:serine protease Do